MTDKKIMLITRFITFRTTMPNNVLWNRQKTRKNKLLIYNSIVKSTVTWSWNKETYNQNLSQWKWTF